MIGPRNYKRLDFYIEEISELYEDSIKSDGFDAHYFNEKIYCYWLSAQKDSIDVEQFKEILKDIAKDDYHQISFNKKKAVA